MDDCEVVHDECPGTNSVEEQIICECRRTKLSESSRDVDRSILRSESDRTIDFSWINNVVVDHRTTIFFFPP